MRGELAERTADLQRVSAEFTNFRRRTERERESTVASAKASVAGELLTVLDDVERAASHGDLTGPFKVVADRLTETLQRAGLTPFGAEGDAFDPVGARGRRPRHLPGRLGPDRHHGDAPRLPLRRPCAARRRWSRSPTPTAPRPPTDTTSEPGGRRHVLITTPVPFPAPRKEQFRHERP